MKKDKEITSTSAADAAEKVKKSSFVKTDRFKRSTAATIFTVIFIALVIVLNVVMSSLTDRFPSMNIDLTAQKLNSLSEDSLNVAKELKKDVTIYLIGSEDAIRGDQIYSSYNLKYSQVANLADKLAEANPSKIKVQFVDPDKDPSFVSNYASDSLTTGKVLVKSEDRYRVLTVSDLFSVQQDSTTGSYKYYSKVDGALANALYLVNLDSVPVIAVATGHEEILSTDNRSAFDQLMKDDCFDVVEFNMLTDEIPENASVVMLPTPTTDYTADEIAKLNAFLSTKDRTVSHSLLVTCHPTQGDLPNLSAFLEDWGLKVGSGLVLESDANKVLSASAAYIYANATDKVLSGTYSNLVAPFSSPIEILFDTNSGISTYPLIQTNDTAYVSLDDQVSDNPDTDTYTTAALAQKSETVENSIVRTNVIVLGNSMSLTESFISGSTFGNRTFMTDLMKYATDTTDSGTGLTISQTETNAYDITGTSTIIFFVGLVVFTITIPLAILIAGLVVFLRRRHL